MIILKKIKKDVSKSTRRLNTAKLQQVVHISLFKNLPVSTHAIVFFCFQVSKIFYVTY